MANVRFAESHLDQGFHADHKVAYSHGGETDITNAQALCPECNLKKGDRIMVNQRTLPEWNSELRKWQQDAFTTFQSKSADDRDFLLVATPAAGKTYIGIRIAHWLFQRGKIDRVIIVVPTAYLKTQWQQDAHRLGGIEINPSWNGLLDHPSYDGGAITFQMVCTDGGRAQRYDLEKVNNRVLVILDEIHHAGEQRSWGDAVQYAYEKAAFRLSLSGTPFRSDNFPIAFLNYDQTTGICKPDFSYDYGQTLHDKPAVCREVLFPSFNGKIEYMQNGQKFSVTFNDQLDEYGGSVRLRMALSTEGEWLRHVLIDANNQLMEVREGQANAAGLVIAMDQRHAWGIAEILEKITNKKPFVVLSDEPD